MSLWDHMKPAEKTLEPTGIEQKSDGLHITWADGVSLDVSTRALRLGCPCAACVEEWSGRKLVDPAQIPADIKIRSLDTVGNYAVAVGFSDGHATGIYSWKTLRILSQVAQSTGVTSPA